MRSIFFKEGKSNFFDWTWTEITEIIFSISCRKFNIFPFILFGKWRLAGGIRRLKAADYRLQLTIKWVRVKISNSQILDWLTFRIWKSTNVQMQPNLRVTTLENKNWEEKESKFIYVKGQIWESAKLRVVRNIEWTNNSKISYFLEFR